MENIVNFKDVEKALLEIRGQRVILDSDVARLYGVETKRVNEAVKNNPYHFEQRRMGDIIFKVENFDLKDNRTWRAHKISTQSLHRKGALHARHHPEKS